jgi:hypothetical protein
MVLNYIKYNKSKNVFDIGDRVITINGSLTKIINKKGTIISTDRSNNSYGVEFDENLGLHNCGKKGKLGHCYYINGIYLKRLDHIENIKEEDIEWF